MSGQIWSTEELAEVIQRNPALDAPKVLALQERVGKRGLRALADRDELEETLKLLPD